MKTVGIHAKLFCTDFKFSIPFFARISNLAKNMISVGLNIENNVGWNMIYPDCFHP
jgi:hypothetical protein